MPRIKFERPVAVTVDGKRFEYPVGTHDVPANVRKHQFIQHWIDAGFAIEAKETAAPKPAEAKQNNKKPATKKPATVKGEPLPVVHASVGATTPPAGGAVTGEVKTEQTAPEEGAQ